MTSRTEEFLERMVTFLFVLPIGVAMILLIWTSMSPAAAEIICTERGCWETGHKIILVSPGNVRGQPLVSHRNGKPEKLRNLGVAESTTPRR
jgi:hypothetical protein